LHVLQQFGSHDKDALVCACAHMCTWKCPTRGPKQSKEHAKINLKQDSSKARQPMMTFGLLKWDFGANTTTIKIRRTMGRLNCIFTNNKKKAPPTGEKKSKTVKGWTCTKEERETGLAQTKKMMNDMTMHIPANPKKILGKAGGKHGDMGTDSAKQSTTDCYITFLFCDW
jgi:hypothetical protein